MMRPVPINMAEAIFEPFWDPQLSGLPSWDIAPGPAHGLEVIQNWCWVNFAWTRRPKSSPALRMSRRFDLDCRGYDTLIASVNIPEGAVFRMQAVTDCGEVALEAPPSPGVGKEVSLGLEGAARIAAIHLEVETGREGIASGWLNWLGLQNSALLPRYLEQFRRFEKEWAGYLKPEHYEPRFEPLYGLLIDKDELEDFRRDHQDFLTRYSSSPFTREAEIAARMEPEEMIHDFVNFWGDTRYCRERDESHLLLRYGPATAVAGLIRRDKDLLRLGARYALAIAHCDTWDDGMITSFPGSTFDHRCFVQSLCTYEIALVLDLAGELFTDLGRNYLLRRLGEQGVGNINQVVWSYEYIFHNNQLAWFTPGRILGYLVLERFWPRVQPYTELALKDLLESLADTILPDGGYVEGPSYFRCVARDGGLSLYHYARARQAGFRSLVPAEMARTSAFAAVMASTDDGADVIPICDGEMHMEQEAVAVMAALLPESAWVNMYRKAVSRDGGFPETVLAWQMSRQIPASGPELPAFIALPDMGVMASVRKLGPERVKLFLMGNKVGAGHTHEDKGSFILEFAGDTFAMDPGTCDYSSPVSGLVQHCERHNMLVPAGLPERPHPESPLPVDVKPAGRGDQVRFSAKLDATPGWGAYYRGWVRSWDAPGPGELVIRDEYELARGTGVEFYWNTRLPVTILEGTVIITGRRGKAEIQVPAGCAARVEELPLLGGDSQRRIAFRKEGASGNLEVRVHLALLQEIR